MGETTPDSPPRGTPRPTWAYAAPTRHVRELPPRPWQEAASGVQLADLDSSVPRAVNRRELVVREQIHQLRKRAQEMKNSSPAQVEFGTAAGTRWDAPAAMSATTWD